MTQYDVRDFRQSAEFQAELGIQRTFMARVYGWMTIGMLATALTALVVASSPTMVQGLMQSGVFWVLVVAELVVAFVFTLALRRLPVAVAAGLFLVYSVLTGATFSVLLLIYTLSSVAATFFITAGMFGGMSIVGYTTKKSLDSIGSFCMMGLWGIIIASVVNFFIGSSSMQWLISFIGVIVFTGLTAYDTQKIKQAYAAGGTGSADNQKTALYGAFALYLDFINLFLFLLRFLGNRRD